MEASRRDTEVRIMSLRVCLFTVYTDTFYGKAYDTIVDYGFGYM